MKIKIKSFIGELPDFLSVGDRHEIEHIGKDGFYHIYIRSIDEYICVNMEHCSYLNGGEWEIVND